MVGYLWLENWLLFFCVESFDRFVFVTEGKLAASLS